MTALKVWNGTSWDTVRSIQGARGPTGPTGVGATPNGAAGSGLTGTYPNPGINRYTAGGLVAVQRDWGQLNQYKAIATGQPILRDNSNTMSISFTPEQTCMWDVDMQVGIMYKTDAAYNYAYLRLHLNVPDADGNQDEYVLEMQHSAVQTFVFRQVSMMWRLNANVTYSCWGIVDTNGGTWQYNQYYPYLWIGGRVYPI